VQQVPCTLSAVLEYRALRYDVFICLWPLPRFESCQYGVSCLKWIFLVMCHERGCGLCLLARSQELIFWVITEI
jgi:hypothetical protein